MEKKLNKKWFLYILKCADGSYYTGITNDLKRRIELHNAGKAARYTRSRRPVTIILKERCKDRSEALKKEYAIKRLNRSKKEGLIKKYEKRRIG